MHIACSQFSPVVKQVRPPESFVHSIRAFSYYSRLSNRPPPTLNGTLIVQQQSLEHWGRSGWIERCKPSPRLNSQPSRLGLYEVMISSLFVFSSRQVPTPLTSIQQPIWRQEVGRNSSSRAAVVGPWTSILRRSSMTGQFVMEW